MSASVISCGGGVVLKDENREILKQACTVIWLWANVETLLKRAKKDGLRPLLEGVDRREDVQKILNERIPLYADIADMVISSVFKDPEYVVSRICDESNMAIEN